MTLREYFAEVGSRYTDEDAKVIGPELDKIFPPSAKQDPAVLVRHAESKHSPLHKYFEWDDAHAAKLYRVDQARQIIKSVHWKIVKVDSAKHFDVGELSHTPVERKVITSTEEEESDRVFQLSSVAKRELAQWKQRYETYARAFPDFAEEYKLLFDVVEDFVSDRPSELLEALANLRRRPVIQQGNRYPRAAASGDCPHCGRLHAGECLYAPESPDATAKATA